MEKQGGDKEQTRQRLRLFSGLPLAMLATLLSATDVRCANGQVPRCAVGVLRSAPGGSDSAHSGAGGEQPELWGQPLLVGRGIAPDWTTPPTGDTATHYRYQDAGTGTTALRPTRILVTDPVRNMTTIERDIAEATTAVIEPQNGAGDPNPTGRVSTVTTYPYLGGPVVETQEIDGSGAVVREAHSLFGKADEVVGARGTIPPGQPNAGQTDLEPEDYGYDAAYHRTSLTQYMDPSLSSPKTTRYGYDLNGQAASIQYPADTAASETDGYNLTMGTATRTIGSTMTTETYGSPSGQLSSVTHSDGTTPSVSYAYDAYDRLTTLTTDGAGGQSYVQQRYAYDDADDVTQATTTDGALPALTMAYSYNPDGSRQSLDFRDSAGHEPAGLARIVYGWDPQERLSVLLDTYDFRFAEWSYRKDDRVQTALGSNLTTTRKGYTPRGLLASLKLSPFAIPARPSIYAGPSGLETDPMRYDASGRRTGLTVTGLEFPGSASYAYDPLGRLTQETPERGGAPSVTHAYDLAGNHWYTGTVNNQTMDWYEFDGVLGGIDPFNPNGPAPFNGSDQIAQNAPWSYDPFGDLTGSPSRGYTFDAVERLTKVTGGSGSTLLTAGYQGDGQRAWKADGSGNRTYFVYDLRPESRSKDCHAERAPKGDRSDVTGCPITRTLRGAAAQQCAV